MIDEGFVPVRNESWGGPRSVSVNGHQEYWEGWFHGFGLTMNPSPYHTNALLGPRSIALVEDEYGTMHEVETHKIKFLQPWGKVLPERGDVWNDDGGGC